MKDGEIQSIIHGLMNRTTAALFSSNKQPELVTGKPNFRTCSPRPRRRQFPGQAVYDETHDHRATPSVDGIYLIATVIVAVVTRARGNRLLATGPGPFPYLRNLCDLWRSSACEPRGDTAGRWTRPRESVGASAVGGRLTFHWVWSIPSNTNWERVGAGLWSWIIQERM